MQLTSVNIGSPEKTSLDKFRQVLTSLYQNGQDQSNLDKFRLIWTSLCRANRTSLDQFVKKIWIWLVMVPKANPKTGLKNGPIIVRFPGCFGKILKKCSG